MHLTKNEILTLFNATVDNCKELFNTAHNIAFKYEGKKYVSLGIAELALEELGKSYSLLAYYSRPEKEVDWKQFWKDWRAHDVKAARSFYYEFFCTVRLVISDPENPMFDRVIPRGRFSVEKELAFYVDIDKGSRAIHIPERDISDLEVMNRVTSLTGLLNPALYIKDWLNSDQSNSFKNAISDYAYITLTEDVYQQDVRDILDHLQTNKDADYDHALEEIWNLFNPDELSGEEDEDPRGQVKG
jgi:AbiV family abortive infection protein